VIARSSFELDACRRIEELQLSIDPYLPLVRKQRRIGRNRLVDVEVAMLQNYFFVPATVDDEQYNAIRFTPGVLDFLKSGGIKPSIMRDSELERVRYRERLIRKEWEKRAAEVKSDRFMIGENVQLRVGFVRRDASVHAIDARGRIEIKLAEGTLFGRDVIPVDPGHLERT
jgi:transcription antitermination factor NusG